jgi:hypothetical protein
MARIPPDRRPIEYHQLCAMAQTVLTLRPHASDAEWKASVLDMVAKQGYGEPASDSGESLASWLPRALTQVQIALERVGWRRGGAPAPEVSAVPVAPATPVAPGNPTPKEWATMVATVIRVIDRSMESFGLPTMPPEARELLRITEHAALDQFYAEASVPCGDKIAVLKRFAEIAIVRESGWDVAAVRAASHNHRLIAYQCFGCGRSSRQVALNWHHVIQIQHGGSNVLRNYVALCSVCHAAVHPWLTASTRPKGFTSLVDIARTIDLTRLKDGK